MDAGQALLYLPKTLTTVEKVGGIICNLCKTIFKNKREFDIHYINHTGNKEIVYQCIACSKEFSTYSFFRGHCYTNHVIKNRYTCTQCDKFFSKQQNLQEHIKLIHGPQCHTCKQRFPSKKELHFHQVVFHINGVIENSCKVCQEQIFTIEECKQHIDLHLSQVYTCPICQETIPDKNRSADHFKKHFWQDNPDDTNPEDILNQLNAIACGLCSIICLNRVEFDTHFSCDHTNKDIFYSCILCGKQFDKYSKFHKHVNNHYSHDQFKCDTCNKTFLHLSTLVSHIPSCCQEYKNHKPYICFYCGNRYLLEHSLLKHICHSHNGFDFRCREPGCEQIFDKRRELMLHSRRHDDRVENWCRSCGQDFISLPSCEQHLEVHKKDLFACPLCSKSYAERSYLLKHIPVHFANVSHVCETCGKAYDAKRRLLEHQKSHSETKVHSCTLCPKSFVKKCHLIQHLNVHKQTKSICCNICQKSFSCLANLNKHLTRVHWVPSNQPVKCDADKETNKKINTKPQINTTEEAIKDWSTFFNLKTQTNIIDEAVINKELQMFDSQEKDYFRIDPMQITDAFESQHTIFETDVDKPMFIERENEPVSDQQNSTPQTVPLEYGPEILNPAVDDYFLPHIDPLLTILTDATPMQTDENNQFLTMQHFPNENEFASENWEPIISKVCTPYYEYEEPNRVSFNTDIF